MSSWEERVAGTRDAVLERERPPEFVCKVLESERASKKSGTERVDSANEEQSLLPSGLRNRRGIEVGKRSNPLSTHEICCEGVESNSAEPTGVEFSVTNFLPLPCSCWHTLSQGAMSTC